ncbi:MAG: glycosyltransferase family 2 protein [Zetaproteobacteria bacterium CG_4_9_14_3_um_filter_49_83]|nr:MAG: hypothetical protein AUJ56_01840 [Zetaproteobacteria bacterium CG1_02_49_23]PIQ34875.1 MAG: glycosyl transferase [Zetaproteobacteria bacterium CG17_big_fil_post_rev_8_21_14_2_50_50_13]PIV31187.1 MAG: glycosyltransferase family 2 protein [Zetaproteobacteria bacterium CG02_land_8_20_14_3_00_50_9]PIY55801.1 MAG: glycosyltransferase family 2 protein [Zetaproteobacteria bacterium CG_4_10_14_0_8_um_filter_49_80]PJA36182.1 MAG: glycosyltransferase family 2 protein [Zetaproteobacteria bacterium
MVEITVIPRITIALAVYNGAATLKEAVLSILNQSFINWELIILNDASTDDSLKVMRSFDDPRIQLVEGEENLGLSARLNMAMDMARGEYFARMDQDDLSFPDRLEKQLQFLESHPDIDLLASATIVFRNQHEILGRLPVQIQHDDICACPWNGFHFPHPTWIGKTDWFRQHRYDSKADGAEDQQFLLRTYQTSRFHCLEEPLLAYREVARPLKKMRRARKIFTRSYVSYLLSQNRYIMAMKVVVIAVIKLIADGLYSLTGFSFLRNSLYPLSEQELAAFKALWHRLERMP